MASILVTDAKIYIYQNMFEDKFSITKYQKF